MDVIEKPSNEANFSLNTFSSFYENVLIKQETDEIEVNTTRVTLDQQKIDNEEIKIEDSGYLTLDDHIQKELLNSDFLNNSKISCNIIQEKRQQDNFLLLKGSNNERMYGCKQCDFSTKHKVSLFRHVKLHNPEEMQSYKCQACEFETLYRRHLSVHVKVLHGQGSKPKLYKCDQCPYACNYRENLSRHKKTHLSPEERNSFVCDICGFETFYKKSYRVHMEMIHPMDTHVKNEESEFKCYHCPFETKYRVNIVRHLKTHMKGDTTVYKCLDCDFQTIHKTNFNTHVLRHKNPGKIKIFQCQHCSHKTYYKASLRNHLKLHMKKEEIETYKCEVCDFATIYERSLRLHVLYMHNGSHRAIEYFKCHFCDFETRYKENWRRHEKGHVRPGKRDTYNCAECSFSTIQQGRYERHLMVHATSEQLAVLNKPEKKSDGKKRFRAVIDTPCSNSYQSAILSEQSGDFKAQTFTDGASQEMTIFQCCHCSYKTLNKKMLKDHLNTHNQDKTVSTNGDVSETAAMTSNSDTSDTHDDTHINNSTNSDRNFIFTPKGKKIFDCKLCPFTTIHRSSIRRHKETHLRPSERKEFKCPTCIFRSYTRARVNSHECPNRS